MADPRSWAGWRFFSWGGRIGAIRSAWVVTEGTWLPDVQAAIERADVMFIIPGTTPSLLEEVAYAMEHRPQYLVFMFPPHDGNAKLYARLRDHPLMLSLAQQVPPAGAFLLPFLDDRGALATALPVGAPADPQRQKPRALTSKRYF